jgi:hypothetical protein
MQAKDYFFVEGDYFFGGEGRRHIHSKGAHIRLLHPDWAARPAFRGSFSKAA